MNREIMKAAGFADEVKLVEGSQCPFCKQAVSNDSFRDELSKREFRISGLCQVCQDSMFGGTA